MRKILTYDSVSADGYFAAPDGNLNWTVPEDALEREARENMADPGPGTVLFGRKTFDMFEKFWPHVLQDPQTPADPHAPHRRSEGLRAMAEYLNEANKIVFSQSRKSSSWKNTRFLPELTREAVERLKHERGKDIMVFGSGSIASKLTELGLIDEYQFIVAPVFLGGGRSLLTGIPVTTRLELLEAKSYPSGNLKIRYGVGSRA